MEEERRKRGGLGISPPYVRTSVHGRKSFCFMRETGAPLIVIENFLLPLTRTRGGGGGGGEREREREREREK